MKIVFARLTTLTSALWLATPAPLWAHSGHGWLAGAAQPVLAIDHFLAGVFVAFVIGLGVILMAGLKRRGARLKP
jgi:hypothetical protein